MTVLLRQDSLPEEVESIARARGFEGVGAARTKHKRGRCPTLRKVFVPRKEPFALLRLYGNGEIRPSEVTHHGKVNPDNFVAECGDKRAEKREWL